MKTRRLVAVFSLLIVSVNAFAQERRQGPPPYDPTREVTIRGSVTSVESITPPDGQEQLVLMIAVDGKPLGVFLGPAGWLKSRKITTASFKPGAAVEVVGLTGARFNGNAAMTPRTVKSGSQTLEIRDAKGVPKWESGGTTPR